jgi:HSP20 family molecular chaperone IbpA
MPSKHPTSEGRSTQRASGKLSRSALIDIPGPGQKKPNPPRKESKSMFNVEEQTTRLERFYKQITGAEPKRSGDAPIAQIPPEANPEQYVQENLQRLQSVMQSAGYPAVSGAVLPTVPPRVAVFEDKDEYRFAVELAGVKKPDLNVQITQGVLRISAIRNWPGMNGESQQPIYAEMGPCRFERVLALPPFVKFDSTDARLENGILTIKCQKDPSAVRRDLKIEVA